MQPNLCLQAGLKRLLSIEQAVSAAAAALAKQDVSSAAAASTSDTGHQPPAAAGVAQMGVQQQASAAQLMQAADASAAPSNALMAGDTEASAAAAEAKEGQPGTGKPAQDASAAVLSTRSQLAAPAEISYADYAVPVTADA